MNDQTPTQQANCPAPSGDVPPPPPECAPPKPPASDCPAPPAPTEPCPPPAPQDPPCPKGKDCPKPPARPCPPKADPCAGAPDAPDPPATAGSPAPAAPTTGTTTPLTPAQQQLEALRLQYEAGQQEMLKFDPLQNRLGDLKTRIASLEKAIAAQPAASLAYTAFYNSIEVCRSSIDCSIPTVRCQLDLSEKTKACVRAAIATIDGRVRKAQADRDAKNAEVAQRRAHQDVLDANVAWAKKWNDFFTTGLQAQVTRLRDDLKALKLLADPAKDQCEVWFYLTEMEAILKSARTDAEGAACYVEDLTLATFLDCWSPKCFAAASQYWIVAFNDADAASKAGSVELTTQIARAAALEKAAADALATRRDAILKELKAQDCCGPASKCP